MIFITFIRAYKWKLIIKSFDFSYPVLRSAKIILIGFFMGLITPGRIGDVVRSFYLKEDSGLNFIQSFSTVFIDRLIDLITLLIISTISIIIGSSYFSTNILYWLIIAAIILLIGSYMITKKGTVKIFLKPLYKLFVPDKYKMKVAENFNDFYDNIRICLKDKRILLMIITLNLYNWLIIFIYTYAIALIAGLDISFLYIILISPLIVLVEIIPVSIAGLGTREAAMIYFLSLVNIGSGLAVSYSILYMVLGGVTFSLIGAILWLNEPIKIKN
tara:strand:+ start:525 stop:1343 length:819 start_codon:yes stop_codon:yes gene_type:complete